MPAPRGFGGLGLIMIERLIGLFETHAVGQHTVFSRLTAHKLSDVTLASFLGEMGAFCQASRLGGKLTDVLTALGLAAQAALIADIIRSEEGHGDDFAAMAKLLLRGTVYAERDWADCGHCKWAETTAAVAAFARRECHEPADALWSLGTMFTVELAAHRQIIPGEVAAFVTSGFYGLDLHEIRYLDEHAGEKGAEHDHEDKIVQVVASLPYNNVMRQMVERGVTEFLDILAAFYNRLQVIIEG
jgi:hypothetical protein